MISLFILFFYIIQLGGKSICSIFWRWKKTENTIQDSVSFATFNCTSENNKYSGFNNVTLIQIKVFGLFVAWKPSFAPTKASPKARLEYANYSIIILSSCLCGTHSNTIFIFIGQHYVESKITFWTGLKIQHRKFLARVNLS